MPSRRVKQVVYSLILCMMVCGWTCRTIQRDSKKGVASSPMLTLEDFIRSIKNDTLSHVETSTSLRTCLGFKVDTLYRDQGKIGAKAYYLAQDASSFSEQFLSAWTICNDNVYKPNRKEIRLYYDNNVLIIKDTFLFGPVLIENIVHFQFQQTDYLLVNSAILNGITAITSSRNIAFIFVKNNNNYAFINYIDSPKKYLDIAYWGDFNKDKELDFLSIEDIRMIGRDSTFVHFHLISSNKDSIMKGIVIHKNGQLYSSFLD